MKKLVVAIAAVFALAVAVPTSAAAQEGRPGGFGIGLGQGTAVSGISGKIHAGETAFQGVLGCYGWACRGVGLSADVLFSMPLLHDEGVVGIGWNLGGGAAIGVGPDRWGTRRYNRRSNFAARAQFVAGIEFLFPDVPLDLVLEWRPSVRVVPSFGLGFLNGGAHIRYWLD